MPFSFQSVLQHDIQIVNGIKREQSSVRGLVDGSTESRLRGVGGTHGTGGGDLSVDVGLCARISATDAPVSFLEALKTYDTGHEGGSSAECNLGDHYELVV